MDTIWADRHRLLREIRAYFDRANFTEVETPIYMRTPCMEEHIDAIACGKGYLRTSPELFHKRIIAAGASRIYEIGKCFRAGEYGDRHHPEYTMLEWYRAHADYQDVLKDTKQLIDQLCIAFKKPGPQWKTYTVEELFLQIAGWNPITAYDADRFTEDLCEKIEPFLKREGGAVVLCDYPAAAAALSRLSTTRTAVAERWELYLDGIEIANAYSELTDAREQRRRFEQWGKQRAAAGNVVYPLDEPFLDALNVMPETGGAALGIDRLLLWLLDAASFNQIMMFRDPWE